MQIILASHNADKAVEFKEIIQDETLKFLTLHDLGYFEDIEESGQSYRENATIKAQTVYKHFALPCIADDSGLSVDVLDGYPGIYSSRFNGVETTYPEKIQCLYKLLENFPPEDWTASFHCALAYISASGQLYHYEACVAGLIIPEARGHNGFGYDPVFYLPALGRTNAELSPPEKHRLSHRGQAVRAWYEDFQAGLLK